MYSARPRRGRVIQQAVSRSESPKGLTYIASLEERSYIVPLLRNGTYTWLNAAAAAEPYI